MTNLKRTRKFLLSEMIDLIVFNAVVSMQNTALFYAQRLFSDDNECSLERSR